MAKSAILLTNGKSRQLVSKQEESLQNYMPVTQLKVEIVLLWFARRIAQNN